MDVEHFPEGVPSWIELSAPDPEESARFYGRLFGWEYADAPVRPTTGGRTALLGGRPVAAITGAAADAAAGWITYVGVDDVTRTAEAVTAAGGRVLAPPADGTRAGRAALFADRSGARFGARQPGERAPAGGVGEPGAFGWAELITDDVESSAAFYGAVLGWTLGEPEGPLARRRWQLGGRSVSGLLPRPPSMPAGIPPYWDVYFTVRDATAALDAVTGLGGGVLMPATSMEHGTIAVFTDPSGAVFTVVAPAR